MNDLERPGCLILIAIASIIVIIFAISEITTTQRDNKPPLDSLNCTTDSLPPAKAVPTPPTPPTPTETTLPAKTSHHEDPTEEAYYDGYDEGYEQGLEDGTYGHPHSYSYDETNDYHGKYDAKYRYGYEDGYEDGYSEGHADYEERED